MAEGEPAPVIEQEMKEYTRIGGTNLGILGDSNHKYGFHVPANQLPESDYSKWRDPNGADGPFVDWDYACAGDFGHGNKEYLLREHRRVLTDLTRGKYPMICEFIGQPWKDRPVLYWARWNGTKTLQRYTGSGHDTWSHIAWYRSKVDERAYLWRTTLQVRYGDEGWAVEFYQRLLSQLGYEDKDGKGLKFDGKYGDATQYAVNTFRAEYGLEPYKGISAWMATQLIEDIGRQKADAAYSKALEDNARLRVMLDALSNQLGALSNKVNSLPNQPESSNNLVLSGELTINVKGSDNEQ